MAPSIPCFDLNPRAIFSFLAISTLSFSTIQSLSEDLAAAPPSLYEILPKYGLPPQRAVPRFCGLLHARRRWQLGGVLGEALLFNVVRHGPLRREDYWETDHEFGMDSASSTSGEGDSNDNHAVAAAVVVTFSCEGRSAEGRRG